MNTNMVKLFRSRNAKETYTKIISFILYLFIIAMIFDRLRVYPEVSISVFRVIALPLLYIMFIILLYQRKILIPLKNSLIWSVLVFLMFAALSIFDSINITWSLAAFLQLIQLIALTFAMCIIIKAIWGEIILHNIAIIMAICGLIGSLSIIMDFFEITNFAAWYLETEWISEIREFGVLGEPNFAAGKLGIFLPFSFFLWSHNSRLRRTFKAGFYLIAASLSLFAIFLTGSRLGLIVVSLSLLIFLLKERRKILKTHGVVPIVIVVLIGFFIRGIITPKVKVNYILRYQYGRFFTSIISRELVDPSMSNRMDLLAAGLRIFSDRPLIGVGLGNYPEAVVHYGVPYNRYSHNTFLAILAETGLIGFLGWMVMFTIMTVSIYTSYRQSQHKDFYFYLGLSFLNLLLMLLFLYDINNKYLWGVFLPLSVVSLDFRGRKF